MLLKNASHRAKLMEIWDSGILVECVCCTFDISVFKGIWVIRCISLKMPCNSKTADQTGKPVEILTQGY